MKKYTRIFISACVLAVVASFAPTGQALDSGSRATIETMKQFGKLSFECREGVCTCEGSADCIDMSNAKICVGEISCRGEICNCTYSPTPDRNKYLQ